MGGFLTALKGVGKAAGRAGKKRLQKKYMGKRAGDDNSSGGIGSEIIREVEKDRQKRRSSKGRD